MGFHAPALAVSFLPTRAVPETVGRGAAVKGRDDVAATTFAVGRE